MKKPFLFTAFFIVAFLGMTAFLYFFAFHKWPSSIATSLLFNLLIIFVHFRVTKQLSREHKTKQ